jgi:hypothetical protein
LFLDGCVSLWVGAGVLIKCVCTSRENEEAGVIPPAWLAYSSLKKRGAVAEGTSTAASAWPELLLLPLPSSLCASVGGSVFLPSIYLHVHPASTNPPPVSTPAGGPGRRLLLGPFQGQGDLEGGVLEWTVPPWSIPA